MKKASKPYLTYAAITKLFSIIVKRIDSGYFRKTYIQETAKYLP